MLRASLPKEVDLKIGQWIEFEDEEGFGYAQPDVFLVLPSRIILFECKLSETLRGHTQLSSLYSPLLEEIYLRPVVKILACKNLTRLEKHRWEVDGIRGAVLTAESDRILTWHWIG